MIRFKCLGCSSHKHVDDMFYATIVCVVVDVVPKSSVA